MPIDPINAAAAYAKAAARSAQSELDAGDGPQAADFAGLVKQAMGAAVQAGAGAEATAAQALTGQADMNDVVLAVANAEIALQTVVAVRDRVVQAYQDILRMPI